MKKVFTSGSCRLFFPIKNGRGVIIPIHSMHELFKGNNFLGKLHNTKQHIQFIKFIKGELDIPQYILDSFLTTYQKGISLRLTWCNYENIDTIPQKIENLRKEFNNCDVYIFEICSLKLCRKDNWEVHLEHTQDYELTIQTEEELYNDLDTIIQLIPANKKIIFQPHFRPNIIYNDSTKSINKREIIYNTISKFIEENKNKYPNIHLHDISSLEPSCFEDTDHLFENGNDESFRRLYNIIYKEDE